MLSYSMASSERQPVNAFFPFYQTERGGSSAFHARALQSLCLGLCQRVYGLWFAKAAPHAADLFPRRADLQRGGRHSGPAQAARRPSRGARRARRSDLRRRRIERYERDRDRGESARRQALPADQAVAQFRPSDRDHGRARLRRRTRGHRDGRGPPGPARSRAGNDRQMEGRLRCRLRSARVARRREPVQAGDRRSLLPPHGAARRRLAAAQRRRFPPRRPQGARLLSRHARARPVRARHVRLDRIPPGHL